MGKRKQILRAIQSTMKEKYTVEKSNLVDEKNITVRFHNKINI